MGRHFVRVLPEHDAADLGAGLVLDLPRPGPPRLNKHIFECNLYFVPAKTCTERLRHELAALSFKEYGLQEPATRWRPPRPCSAPGVVKDFPLCDQEILLRHLHKAVGDYVEEYRNATAR